MKVLVVSDLYPPDMIGGYELGCRQAVDALRTRGHEVRVLTSAPRTPVQHEAHVRRTMKLVDAWSDYVYRKSAPVTVHLDQGESLHISSFNVHALIHELKEFQPDVVYVWMLVGVGGLGLMACLHHLGVPWVWHLMDDVPLMLCKSHGSLVPTFAREFSRQLHGHYLACSQQLVEEIEAGGVSLNGSIELIPNWISGNDRGHRQPYLRDGTLRVVSAAGLIDRQVDKGMDVLIESAARLRELGHTNFTIDIYGKVTDDHCPSLIHTHELESQVRLRGSRSQAELADAFSESDVFAFPTRAREPFGFAPLEAAARGCVPVVSQACGIAEWFLHGVHLLKARRNPESFAKLFAAIASGSIELESIGRRGSAVIRREFHIDAIVPRIERALASAARQSREGSGTAEEAYRLAILAEKLSKVMIQESLCA
ncbi:MAG: glycosyltransferase [Planctomycetota bacterium]|nr:glycosyltransferase [Planctomycetota bacterium]